MSPISREPLRTEVRRLIIERLIVGEIEPGSQVNESQLTEELGVSRTPLREALLKLAFEGFLDTVPGKGFQVRPLTARELRELFTVGVTLETMALRQAGGVTPEQLDELREITDRRAELLAAGAGRDRLVQLDDRWHRLLVSNCENEQLLHFLQLARNRMYRYLYAFDAERDQVEAASRDRREIHQALAEGNLDRAVASLKRHWVDSRDTLADRIEIEEK